MSDAGYTLIEVLVALVMIGLALAGLVGAVQVMGRQQWRAASTMADNDALRSAAHRLEDMFSRASPFRSADAGGSGGDASGFWYGCGRAAPCRVGLTTTPTGLALATDDGAGGQDLLPLRRPGPAVLRYQGVHGDSPVWPPRSGGPEALRALVVVRSADAGETPLVVARVWPEQPRICQFDVIAQDCR